MSEGIQELLRRAAPHAQRPLDVEALVRTAHRRSQRRRLGSSLGVAVIIGGMVAGGIALASGGRGGSRSVVAGAPGTNPAAGVTARLPAGWSDLPLADTGDPNQILVVGNVSRPASASINVCDTVPGSAYASLYEFAPNPPFTLPVSESGTLKRATFQQRPADFTTASLVTSDFDCAAGPNGAPVTPETTSPAAAPDHFIYYAFEDAKRLFFAKISSRGDASRQLLQQAIGVLNSLRVQPGSFLPPDATAPTTTVVPLAPSTTTLTLPAATGSPPADQAGARHQIQAALTFAFRGGTDKQRQESVEGGYPLDAATQQQLARQNSSLVGTISVRINELRFLDQSHAAFIFDLLLNGRPVTVTTAGQAVYDTGKWRVTRSTYCTVIDRGSIPCPA